MQLRPYQQRGLSDIFKAWEFDDLVFFQLATGGGKTVIFTEVIMKYLVAGKRAMLVAHREELISQAWKTLFRSNIYAGIIQSNISAILHDDKFYPVDNRELPCQVCSIQTIARRRNLPPADLIVIDEGHHVTDDNSYGNILKQYPNAKILIVSATPYRLSGEGFQEIIPGKVTRLITNSTLRDLITDGWLVPLKLFAAHVPDMSDVDLSKGEYREDQAYEKMKLAPVVQSWIDHAQGKQGVTFAVNVKHSIELVQQYWAQGIPAEHVDANTKPEERKRIITDFKAGLVKVVSNVGIFIEGTDFPNCEFVQLARPTMSLAQNLQMIGRGTRPLAGLVDPLPTAEARVAAIAASAKPECIVLDCVGSFKTHKLPTFPHDWGRFFRGEWKRKKGEKKEEAEQMEMLVYVAEDGAGNTVRTRNIKEIEGMRLVEITEETQRKIITITSLKEFDALLGWYKNKFGAKSYAYDAVTAYVKQSQRVGALMHNEVWQYIERKVITEPLQIKDQLESNRRKSTGAYPETMHRQALATVEAGIIDKATLLRLKDEYFRRNRSALIRYAQSKQAAAENKPYLNL